MPHSSSQEGQPVCANVLGITSADIIVRRFSNSDCPGDPDVEGSEEGLTGWITLDGSLFSRHVATITACVGLKETYAYRSELLWYHKHKGTLYSEVCGGKIGEPNAFTIRVGPRFGTTGVSYEVVK